MKIIYKDKTNSRLIIDFVLFKLTFKQNKNYFYKIKYFLLKVSFLPAKNKKKYDYIVPVGQNCKYSVHFHRIYKFVDSTLLNWADVTEKDFLCDALANPQLIFSQGCEYWNTRNMWICNKYKISFHARSSLEDLMNEKKEIDENLKQKDYSELVSRIKYLTEKTIKIINSDKKKLFVYTFEHFNPETDFLFTVKLYSFFRERSKNFDFLVILYSDSIPEEFVEFEKNNQNVYVKNIKIAEIDLAWLKIMREFSPNFKKKQTKKLKFE